MRDHLLCHELACRPRAAGFLGRALGSTPGPRVSPRGQATDAGALQAGPGCWFWFWPHNMKAHKDGEHMLYRALGPGKGVLPEEVHSKRKSVSKNTRPVSHSQTHKQHACSFSDTEYPGLGRGCGYRSVQQKQSTSEK